MPRNIVSVSDGTSTAWFSASDVAAANWARPVLALAVAIALLVGLFLPIGAGAQEIKVPFIAVDGESGEVLLENRAFHGWHPASLTKLMTVYVTLDAIRSGEISPGSPVEISNAAVRQPPSKMGYPAGTRLRVDIAMKILVVKSANDVAVALAEAVAGNVAGFVTRMNDTAKRLGMYGSHFANPHGLHDAEQVVTARDMALLTRQLFIEFPEFSENFAVPAIRAGDQTYYSYNLLLERFRGADGVKTGFVCASGYNMVASATRNGRRIIVVVMGTASQTDRAVTAARLLRMGFERDTGIPLLQYRPLAEPEPASSQRAVICSEEAREDRYDPGAGNAQIDSPYLDERQTTREPITVSTGGIDAPASEAYRFAQFMPRGEIPVPAPRPDYAPRDVNGVEFEGYGRIPGGVPLPSPRPEDLASNQSG